ncbi:MAG: response regulator [Deltaproteobacteria bacterium]|nr:response regulator [Deltaproteobacteria bacterium]
MHSSTASRHDTDAPPPLTVLIVDDEPAVGKALQRRLRGRCEVLLASSGPEALALVETAQPHVVITDEHMPGMMGTELLARVEQSHPTAMRVLLTGQPSLDLMVRSLQLKPVQRVLFKPCPLDEVDALLQKIRGRRARDERVTTTAIALHEQASARDAHAANSPAAGASGPCQSQPMVVGRLRLNRKKEVGNGITPRVG